MNRRLNLESLEHRLLLAADVAFQNPLLYQDVNFDSHVSQVDALQVINHLNYPELYDVDAPVGAFLDVSGDNAASAIDALQIINELNGTEQTNEALFEQVETFAGEVELMQELLPEDIESLGQNLLLRVQEQADEIADMREQLEEFLQTPRHAQDLLLARRDSFRQRAADLADHYIKEFNKLNHEPELNHLEKRDLKELGLHKRLRAEFSEVRQERQRDYKWEDYLPHDEVSQEQVDEPVSYTHLTLPTTPYV